MRTGLMLGATSEADNSLDKIIQDAQDAEARGFDDLWMANIFSFDAISTLSLVGRETTRIGLGTAVTPTFPRHPTAIAQQALTAGAASGGRFRLGIGLSHKVVIEDMLGFSYDKPARHMREYLSVLAPLLRGETATFQGEHYQVNNINLDVPGSGKVPVLIAALGPVMLKIAGELADGTITWMTGPKTLETHIIPTMNAAADIAGRPTPSVVAGFPIVLTNKPDEAREFIGKALQIYGVLPSYRAMLDREGMAGPADLALVGDERQLRQQMAQLSDIGITDFCASITTNDAAEYTRTLDFLGDSAA